MLLSSMGSAPISSFTKAKRNFICPRWLPLYGHFVIELIYVFLSGVLNPPEALKRHVMKTNLIFHDSMGLF